MNFTITHISKGFNYYLSAATLTLDVDGIEVRVDDLIKKDDSLLSELFGLTCGLYHEDSCELIPPEFDVEDWSDFARRYPDAAKTAEEDERTLVLETCADMLPHSDLWPLIVKYVGYKKVQQFYETHVPSDDDISITEDDDDAPSEACIFFAKMLAKKMDQYGLDIDEVTRNADTSAHQDFMVEQALVLID